nr:hypothetical protein [Tanacetum cinerariifolium]
MMTLLDKAILSGAENHPPMLEKDMYESWKIIMELYMMNRRHGHMILESVEQGPLILPTIKENGLTVPVFKDDDDPIDAINHMMSFLSAVVTSRFLTTNNQLMNSSNPHQQATIHDGRVKYNLFRGDRFLMLLVHQIPYATGTSNTYTPGTSASTNGKQRAVICYNYKGEAQANGNILHDEELQFLAVIGIPKGQATQSVITHNIAYQANDLDAYDFNCDELNTAIITLMANLSHFGSYALVE